MEQFDLNVDKKIVVVGTIFMDIKGYPEGDFYPTGRNKGRIEYTFGGVARNVAEDLAGLGFHPVFVSMSDPEGNGEACVRHLEEAGVITDYILREDQCIGTWMVILTPEGDVCANLSRRQDLMPLCDYLKNYGDEIFSRAHGILLEMDVDEPVVEEVYNWSRKYSIPLYGVISNMSIAKERMEYIKETACFICNRQEAGLLFDIDDMEHMAPEQLAEIMPAAMAQKGIRSMVITMDSDGAVYAETKEEQQMEQENNNVGICPALSVKVVDSTGAGDSFFAGVSAGLIAGMNMDDACRMGTRMAAKVITSGENVFHGWDD